MLRRPCADVAGAAAEFDAAFAIARSLGAKSLELRAALSLARLWSERKRGEEALSTLAEICSSFSAGVDTADLRAAHALLGQLLSSSTKTSRV
jgi:predicted ATPase